MKNLILLFLIPQVVFSQQTTTKDELALSELNKKIFSEYVINHNTDFFDEVVDKDFIFVAAIGHKENKEQVLAGVKNLDIETLEVTTDKIVLKEDIAVITGILRMEGTIMGKEIPREIRYMSVFIKENDMWKLQARTMTPILRVGKK